MPHINRLSDKTVRSAPIGKHHDGGGLYLQVAQGSNDTSKSWVLRYAVGKKSRYIGLGAFPLVGLKEAREKAADTRRQISGGIDPIAHKRAARASLAHQNSKKITFSEVAANYLSERRATWRGARHIEQWVQSVAYLKPRIGEIPVAEVDIPTVLGVLRPIWFEKPVAAARLRNRGELILDYAAAHGDRTGENPARWSILGKALPRPTKVKPVRSHAMLDYREAPAFMAALRDQAGMPARALESLTLVAARKSEVTGMTWDEVDLVGKVWVVRGERMKGGKPHRVALSSTAIALLNQLPRRGEHVFPGARRAQLSHEAMNAVLARMGKDCSVHGQRACFATWAREETTAQREVIEQALAHAVGDAVERAYARGDALEKRRVLMEQWAQYLEHGPVMAEVVPLRKHA
jgi:integrase